MKNKAVKRPVETKPVKWVKKDEFKQVESKKFDKWLAERPLGE